MKANCWLMSHCLILQYTLKLAGNRGHCTLSTDPKGILPDLVSTSSWLMVLNTDDACELELHFFKLSESSLNFSMSNEGASEAPASYNVDSIPLRLFLLDSGSFGQALFLLCLTASGGLMVISAKGGFSVLSRLCGTDQTHGAEVYAFAYGISVCLSSTH